MRKYNLKFYASEIPSNSKIY